MDFANAAHALHGLRQELLTWPILVEFFMATGGVTPEGGAPLRELENAAPEETGRVLALAVELRDALREILHARETGQPLRSEWIAPINAVLRHTEGHDWLERLEGAPRRDWRLVLRARSQGLEWLLAAIARSAAELVAEGPAAPIRKCANPKCTLFFYDTSRTGKRRWCSMATCGNRAKVAAHFRRIRAKE